MIPHEQLNRQASIGALVGLLAAAETLAGSFRQNGKIYKFKGKQEINRMLDIAERLNTALESLFTPGENDHLNYLSNDIKDVVRLLAIAPLADRTRIANGFRREYAKLMARQGDTEAVARCEAETSRTCASRGLPDEGPDEEDVVPSESSEIE